MRLKGQRVAVMVENNYQELEGVVPRVPLSGDWRRSERRRKPSDIPAFCSTIFEAIAAATHRVAA